MEKVSKTQYAEWKQHPVTEVLFQELEVFYNDLAKEFISGSCIDSATGTIKEAKLRQDLAQADVIKDILESDLFGTLVIEEEKEVNQEND